MILPELFGVHLLASFAHKLISVIGEERYNKLNPADMFVNLFGGPAWLHGLGWVVLGAMALFYARLLWRVWRECSADSTTPWELTPRVQQAMLAAFMFLPYTLAYDITLAAGAYLWRFKANGYQLDRPLTWNLAFLWLLPILTLVLHALAVPTTLNPLLIIGLFLLLQHMPTQAERPASAELSAVGATSP